MKKSVIFLLLLITIPLVLADGLLVRTNAEPTSEFYLALGDDLYEHDQKELALQVYEKGLSIDSEHKLLRNNAAYLAYELQDYDKAITHFTVLTNYNTAKFWYDLAIVEVEQFRKEGIGSLETALEHYEQAANINPEYAYVQENTEVLRNILA